MKLKLIPGKEVVFNEDLHQYTVDGREAISVTTLLTQVGISEDFSKLPDAVKQKVEGARIRGNAYDALAEDAINAPYDLNEWQKRFLEELEANVPSTEHETQIRLGMHVVNENDNILLTIAGSPDILGYLEGGFNSTTDVKATYKINEISVTWQTNLYNIMKALLIDVEKFEEIHNGTSKHVLHFQESLDTFTTKELQNVTLDVILLMLQAAIEGKQFTDGEFLTKNIDLNTYAELADELDELDIEIANFIEERKERIDEIKADMKEIEDSVESLVNNSVLKAIEAKGFKFTLTRPSKRRNVSYQSIYNGYEDVIYDELMVLLNEEDKKKLENKLKKIVDDNISVSNVKGNFKVTKLKTDEKA